MVALCVSMTRNGEAVFVLQLALHKGGDSPFVEMPKKPGLSELECMVFDRVSWSDTPTFHNTLVVGSSPTSSLKNFVRNWRIPVRCQAGRLLPARPRVRDKGDITTTSGSSKSGPGTGRARPKKGQAK